MVKFMGAFCGEQDLDLSLIEFRTPSQKLAEDFHQLVLNDMGNTVEISKVLKEWTNLRYDIFYASKNALPLEPDNIDELLRLSAWLSLGLIWAVNAVTVDPKVGQVFASQFLKTARKIIDEPSAHKQS